MLSIFLRIYFSDTFWCLERIWNLLFLRITFFLTPLSYQGKHTAYYYKLNLSENNGFVSVNNKLTIQKTDSQQWSSRWGPPLAFYQPYSGLLVFNYLKYVGSFFIKYNYEEEAWPFAVPIWMKLCHIIVNLGANPDYLFMLDQGRPMAPLTLAVAWGTMC